MNQPEHSRRGRKRKFQTNVSSGRPAKRRKGSRDHQQRYCVCQQPDNGRPFVGCDSCHDWFHPECVGTTLEQAASDPNWLCPKCSAARQLSTRRAVRTKKQQIPMKPVRSPRLELDEIQWTNGYRLCGTSRREHPLPRPGPSSASFRESFGFCLNPTPSSGSVPNDEPQRGRRKFFDAKRVDRSQWDLDNYDFSGRRGDMKEREPPRPPPPRVLLDDDGGGENNVTPNEKGAKNVNVDGSASNEVDLTKIDDDDELEAVRETERRVDGTIWFNLLTNIREEYNRREMNVYDDLLSSKSKAEKRLSRLLSRAAKLTRALRNLKYLNAIYGKIVPTQNFGGIAEYKVTPPSHLQYSVAFLNVNHIDYNETIPCPKCGGQIPSNRGAIHIRACLKDTRSSCSHRLLAAVDLESNVVPLEAVCGYAMYLSDGDTSKKSLSDSSSSKVDVDGDVEMEEKKEKDPNESQSNPCTLAEEYMKAHSHADWEDKEMYCLSHKYPCPVHDSWRDERFALKKEIEQAREQYQQLTAAVGGIKDQFRQRRISIYRFRRRLHDTVRNDRKSLVSPIDDVYTTDMFKIGAGVKPFVFQRKDQSKSPEVVPKSEHQHVSLKESKSKNKSKTTSPSSSVTPKSEKSGALKSSKRTTTNVRLKRTPNGVTTPSKPNPVGKVPTPSLKPALALKSVAVQSRSKISTDRRPAPRSGSRPIPQPHANKSTTNGPLLQRPVHLTRRPRVPGHMKSKLNQQPISATNAVQVLPQQRPHPVLNGKQVRPPRPAHSKAIPSPRGSGRPIHRLNGRPTTPFHPSNGGPKKIVSATQASRPLVSPGAVAQNGLPNAMIHSSSNRSSRSTTPSSYFVEPRISKSRVPMHPSALSSKKVGNKMIRPKATTPNGHRPTSGQNSRSPPNRPTSRPSV